MPSSSSSIFQSQEASLPYVTTGGKSSPFFPVLQTSFERATHADIIVAFTQDSGLRLLQTAILDALERGVSIRILTSNYLHITQASALQRLLDWKEQSKLRGAKGTLDIKIFEATKQSFHPKAWFFKSHAENYAFVGSSNWSFSALCTGIEWNIRLDQASSQDAFEQLTTSFQALWIEAKPLTINWLKEYILACKQTSQEQLPLGEVYLDTEEIVPTKLQEEALAALEQTIKDKHRRGLFVLATGLGKTFLSAFAAKQLGATRILFLVHRKEILLQASSSFRQIFHHHTFGWCIDNRLEQAGDITFGSVQKLSRDEHLSQFERHFFDLIIIDEVHHAAASSYQKIIHHFAPQFLLGLTATPNRSDHLDILPLFDDHIIYQADLWAGIEQKRLVPFQYIGRLDSVNYQAFVQNDGSLDIESMEKELQNQERMALVWKYCQEYKGTRTVFFCSNIAHADFCAAYLRNKGLKIVSVHSGSSSGPRISSIEHLRKSRLDAIAAVDLFNEGIDIPEIDRIVMLRPTSSSVLFLQQLGRGLRISSNKDQLVVIDIIGNHRSFASRINAILSLSSQNDFGLWVQGKKQLHLPPLCSLEVELGVLDFFASSIPKQNNSSRELLQQFCFIQGTRPSLSALIQLGAKHYQLLEKHSSWFAFLIEEKLLSLQEEYCFKEHQKWFEMIERTSVKKSFKLIAIQAFIQENAFSTGIDIDHFCAICYQNIFNVDLLRSEIPASKKTPAAWKKYWIKWLHSIWESEHNWLLFQFERVWINFSFKESETLYKLSWEILQFRLLSYSLRPSVNTSKQLLGKIKKNGEHLSIEFKEPIPKHLNIISTGGVFWSFASQSNKISGKSIQPQLYQFIKELFHQNIQNILKNSNQALHIYLELIDNYWYPQPLEGSPSKFLDRIEVPCFHDLFALKANNLTHLIRLPNQNSSPFNSFAFPSPCNLNFIQKNDWLLCQKAKTIVAKQLKDKYILFQPHPKEKLQIAKVILQGSHFLLQLQAEWIPYSPTIVLWGIIENVIPRSSLMPLIGTTIPITEFSNLLGLSEAPTKTFQNIDGHPFLLLKTQEPPKDFEYTSGFVFAFQKRRKYFLYLGLWFWNGTSWKIDSEHRND